MRRETTATAPAFTRALARALPKRAHWMACAGVHTIPAGYGDCIVCGRDWTSKGKRKWLRFYGERSPIRRGRPSETNLHVVLVFGICMHRVTYWRDHSRWIATWNRKGDHHTAHLRPDVSFSHCNTSAQYRMEQAERECVLIFEEDEHDEAQGLETEGDT